MAGPISNYKMMSSIKVEDLLKVWNKEIELSPWQNREEITERGWTRHYQTSVIYPIEGTNLVLDYNIQISVHGRNRLYR